MTQNIDAFFHGILVVKEEGYTTSQEDIALAQLKLQLKNEEWLTLALTLLDYPADDLRQMRTEMKEVVQEVMSPGINSDQLSAALLSVQKKIGNLSLPANYRDAMIALASVLPLEANMVYDAVATTAAVRRSYERCSGGNGNCPFRRKKSSAGAA